MITQVLATKIKRLDKIETLLNGIKEVDYIVHYPKNKCVCIVYTDKRYIWCTDSETIEVDRKRRNITLKHVTNEFANYDKPIFINSNEIINQYESRN